MQVKMMKEIMYIFGSISLPPVKVLVNKTLWSDILDNVSDTQPFDDPNANFVRSLTFRSADAGRMSDVFRNIQELKKNVVKREAEKKEMEDVVEQENLREIRNRRPQRLT